MSELVKVVGRSNDVPYCVHVMLTTKCQMTCKGCYYKGAKPGEWHPRKLEKLIVEAQKLGVKWMAFGGGEPTLYPWITGILSMASVAGLKTSVTTNGANLTYLPADIIHISHDKMHLPKGMSWKRRDAIVRTAIKYYRATAPDRIGLNTLVTDAQYIPIETLRLVDNITLLQPKPYSPHANFGTHLTDFRRRCEQHNIKAELSADGCLYHLIQTYRFGFMQLGARCSQGRTSMCFDVHGRVAACSNIKKTFPAKGVKDGWDKVRRKKDVDPAGCVMPRFV